MLGEMLLMILPENSRSRPANDENAEDRISAALSMARRLVKFGMPVFPASVDDLGNPDVHNDTRWSRWQRYPADLDILDKYKRGDALCAVCGIVFDVIDIDPRNGGKFSFRRLSEELGDLGPVVYGKVKTPSGGMHLYIAALGIGSHNNIMPGIDLKGGFADGSGRGFVFMPPTIRPVKGLDGDGGVITGEDASDRVRMGTYRWTNEVLKPGGDSSSEELTGYLLAAIEANRGNAAKKAAIDAEGKRSSSDELRRECIIAAAGQQRIALLRYVGELEKRGYAKPDIILLLQTLASEMPLYNKKRPWYPANGAGNPNRELLALFHRPGQIIPDADPDELQGINDGPSVARVIPSGLTAFSEINRSLTEWLWVRYLAIGNITIFDGDAGIGKSLVTLDIISRLSVGADMPDGSRCPAPSSSLLLAPEDSDNVTANRLDAAGADTSKIYKPALILKRKKGEEHRKAYSGNDVISFPSATEKVKSWIKAYGVRLMIVDPITAFLDEDINSNNDASVRRALSRLASALDSVGCSALFIRHYNKNTQLAAAHRGGGSVAFGAVSRVQIVGGPVPPSDMTQIENPPAKLFAITQAKNNHLGRRPDEALSYAIEDSDIPADIDGNMTPRIAWYGKIALSPEEVTSGPEKKKPGPNPVIQEEILTVLNEMFKTIEIWDSSDALDELRKAGITANKNTIDKTRKSMGIFSKARREKGKAGIQGWDWCLRTIEKVTDDDDDDD